MRSLAEKAELDMRDTFQHFCITALCSVLTTKIYDEGKGEDEDNGCDHPGRSIDLVGHLFLCEMILVHPVYKSPPQIRPPVLQHAHNSEEEGGPNTKEQES